jgi:2'-5' RNA ligase
MKISLWLLPVPDQAARLSKQIQAFSRMRQRPAFLPHLTLYAPIHAAADLLRNEQAMICAQQAPVELTPTGVSHSEAHYRAVVIELAATPELRDWQQALQQRWFPTDERVYAPHLSLVYDQIPVAERAAMAQETQWASHYRFDRLAAVKTESSDPAGHHYQEWELLWELPLSG